MQYLLTLALDFYLGLGLFFYHQHGQISRKTQISTKYYCFYQTPLPSDNKKLQHASNPMLYPEYIYLSKSKFMANWTNPNKKFPKKIQRSVLCLNGHKFISNTLLIFTTVLWLNVSLSCFKQLPWNCTCILVLT